MQDELAAEGLALPIQILGVNPAGHESGNAAMCDGRDLPWLQETVDVDVQTEWSAEYRDVVLVNAANEKASAYNLTAHDLSIAANYDELKALLRETVAGTR